MQRNFDPSGTLGDAVQTAEKGIVTVFAGHDESSTGVVWSSDLVVTAVQGLEQSEAIEVGSGEARRPATVVGADPLTDLLVLRVDGGLSPPPRAELDSLRVGELVVALSRPARGLRARLGIVSRLGGPFRLPGGQEVARYVESDIAPAPGHSGSVLVSAAGGLIGLNKATLSRGSLVALPLAAVGEIVDAIATHGRVRRARLGVGLERVELPRAVAERRGQKRALLVTSVLEGSAAERGGVVLGDVILAAGGRAVTRADDLMAELGARAIGTPLAFDILRAGAEAQLELQPEPR